MKEVLVSVTMPSDAFMKWSSTVDLESLDTAQRLLAEPLVKFALEFQGRLNRAKKEAAGSSAQFPWIDRLPINEEEAIAIVGVLNSLEIDVPEP